MRAELCLRLEFGLTGSPDNLLFCYGNKAFNILVIRLAVAWAAKRNRWTLTFNTTLVRNLRVRACLCSLSWNRLRMTRNITTSFNHYRLHARDVAVKNWWSRHGMNGEAGVLVFDLTECSSWQWDALSAWGRLGKSAPGLPPQEVMRSFSITAYQRSSLTLR